MKKGYGRRRAGAATMAGLLALVLGGAVEAEAVATATGSGIRLTNPDASPVAHATVTISFNGQTATGQTDDRGEVAILFRDDPQAQADDPPGAVVLTGDGTGVITYPGGPAGGEGFAVRRGAISMTGAAGQAVQSGKGGGLGKMAYIGGGAGALALGVLALSGGDSDGEPGRNPGNSPGNGSGSGDTPSLSRFYGAYNGNFSVTGGTGCVARGSVPVPIRLSGNPDGTNFVFDKGGLLFRGMLAANGSFQADYVGPVGGFPGLPAGTNVQWRLSGNVNGTEVVAGGEATVTSGACNRNVIQTSVSGRRS